MTLEAMAVGAVALVGERRIDGGEGVNNNKIFKVTHLAGIASYFPALSSFAPEITGG